MVSGGTLYQWSKYSFHIQIVSEDAKTGRKSAKNPPKKGFFPAPLARWISLAEAVLAQFWPETVPTQFEPKLKLC